MAAHNLTAITYQQLFLFITQTIIRVPPGCFIFYQSCLLLLQYHRTLFLHFLNM